MRLVYDASAKPVKSAYSLNDCLHLGPILLQNLAEILLRFLLHSILLLFDIKKAFF